MSVRLPHIFQVFNLLSFDVALGACAGMYFFADMFGIELGLPSYLLMAISVWSIYTFDHLLDAHFIESQDLSQRHYFHQHHFKILSCLLAMSSLSALVLAFYLLSYSRIFFFALILALLVFLQMILSQYFKQQMAAFKEVSIAVFYVVGITFLPASMWDHSLTDLRWLLFSCGYAVIASFNLILFSLLDRTPDFLTKQPSIVSKLGAKRVKTLLRWLGISGIGYFLSLFLLLPSYYHVYTTILLLMLIWNVRFLLEQEKNNEVARRKLEMAFLFPWVLLLIA